MQDREIETIQPWFSPAFGLVWEFTPHTRA